MSNNAQELKEQELKKHIEKAIRGGEVEECLGSPFNKERGNIRLYKLKSPRWFVKIGPGDSRHMRWCKAFYESKYVGDLEGKLVPKAIIGELDDRVYIATPAVGSSILVRMTGQTLNETGLLTYLACLFFKKEENLKDRTLDQEIVRLYNGSSLEDFVYEGNVKTLKEHLSEQLSHSEEHLRLAQGQQYISVEDQLRLKQLQQTQETIQARLKKLPSSKLTLKDFLPGAPKSEIWLMPVFFDMTFQNITYDGTTNKMYFIDQIGEHVYGSPYEIWFNFKNENAEFLQMSQDLLDKFADLLKKRYEKYFPPDNIKELIEDIVLHTNDCRNYLLDVIAFNGNLKNIPEDRLVTTMDIYCNGSGSVSRSLRLKGGKVRDVICTYLELPEKITLHYEEGDQTTLNF